MIQIDGIQVRDLLVFSILLVAFVIQSCYWLSYIRVLRRIPSPVADAPVSVSVIVVVNMNHLEWIQGDMEALFAQDHPVYEVIVVNDCGGEELTTILQRMCIEHPIMRYTEIFPDRKFGHTVKVAKLMGIKCARYDNVIFVEPWTRPSSTAWLRNMSSGFGKGHDIVIGMSVPDKDDKWWNGFARSFSICSLIRASRAAMSGKPYMASRSNFGFTKNVFFSSGGYNFLTTGYGDNDLYLRHIAKPGNSSAVLSSESIMLQSLPSGFGTWMDDMRYLTATFMHYRAGVKISSFVYLSSLALFWIMMSISVVLIWPDPVTLALPLSLFLLRQTTVYSLYGAIARKLGLKGVLGAFVIYDLLAPFWELGLWLSRRFGNPSRF